MQTTNTLILDHPNSLQNYILLLSFYNILKQKSSLVGTAVTSQVTASITHGFACYSSAVPINNAFW